MRAIRVLIADDHSLVRQGLISMLATCEEIEVVGEASDGVSAVEEFERLVPDVVLLDVRMPEWDGIRVVHHIRQSRRDAKIIMLTTYDDDEYVFGALREGANGYLLKSISRTELSKAIHRVYRGERLVAEPLMTKVLQHFEMLAKKEARQAPELSQQEIQVLRAVAEGRTNREIAEKNYWSEITVKRRIQDIFHKLGVSDRTQAASEAIRRNLI
ncbi:MAG: response regulator transcription factor [Chloroflexi bacterium]|nr:response regulator transcription factor [Chloroflexota bacterium]